MFENNLKEVRSRIQRAAERSGRKAEDVILIGVSKYQTVEDAKQMAALGLQDFGENRLPHALEKLEALHNSRVHFIGHLQTNKVNKVVGHFCCLHSLDSDGLAEAVIKRAGNLGICQDVFVQVNVSGEESKGGYRPEELPAMLKKYRGNPQLNILGLMTMAPNGLEEKGLREIFGRLRKLAEENDLHALSMGMSNDFEIAIEEGATHVRVGRLLFEK